MNEKFTKRGSLFLAENLIIVFSDFLRYWFFWWFFCPLKIYNLWGGFLGGGGILGEISMMPQKITKKMFTCSSREKCWNIPSPHPLLLIDRFLRAECCIYGQTWSLKLLFFLSASVCYKRGFDSRIVEKRRRTYRNGLCKNKNHQ